LETWQQPAPADVRSLYVLGAPSKPGGAETVQLC
jgi:hypothetical protein